MVILIDTREQRPLPFKADGAVTGTRRTKLSVGDYGCEYNDGTRPPLFFERKSITDLFSTMGKGYARFKDELNRAKLSNYRLVLLIEGSLSAVYKGVPRSDLRGESVVKKLFTLWVKYDLYPVFCSRAEMVEYIRESYEAIGRLAIKKRRS